MFKTVIACLALGLMCGSAAAAVSLEELSDYSGVSVSELRAAQQQARYQQKIIDAITRPSEAKPWHEYRDIFISRSRIRAGVEFYRQNEATLRRAERDFGVPPEIICAIIGVETFFGQNMGTWRVLDATYTLGFHYPRREEYFAREFANYVKLARREGWKLTSIQGSYAGAMGLGQFMPDAYLRYAVDYDGDGRVNLFTNRQDAIGSVANYFREKGQWQPGQPIFYPAYATRNPEALIAREWEVTARELYEGGISTKELIDGDQQVRLMKFDLRGGKVGYGVGLNNYHAIMRYNKSQLYARAVFELAEFIRSGYEKARTAAR